jgi:hypothetical protein
MPKEPSSIPNIFNTPQQPTGPDRLTLNERMIKYGLYPEEFNQAIEMDREHSLEELKRFCKAEGLPSGGEKKKLIANLIISRRSNNERTEPGMDRQAGGGTQNPGRHFERYPLGSTGIEFQKNYDLTV